MNHIPIVAPALCLLLFILWVEGTALKLRLKRYSADITRTFGHADRIYRGERGWREGKRICKQLI
jgi:hypothetical protein